MKVVGLVPWSLFSALFSLLLVSARCDLPTTRSEVSPSFCDVRNFTGFVAALTYGIFRLRFSFSVLAREICDGSTKRKVGVRGKKEQEGI